MKDPDPSKAMIRRLAVALAVLVAVALGGIFLLSTLHLRTPTETPSPPRRDEAGSASPSSSDRPPEDFVAIPGGEFFAGCNEQADSACLEDEKPGGVRRVEAFAIDRTEVTVAAYQACVAAGVCTESDRGEGCNAAIAGHERHPINCVDWEQARAYCVWRGARLPTEWEWERAARGTDGRIHPWGNAPADCRRAVFDDGAGSACGQGDTTAPVGSKPEGASPEGVLDLIGNVWEWTDSTREGSPSKVVRGGAYYVDALQTRASFGLRFDPRGQAPFTGLRCAR